MVYYLASPYSKYKHGNVAAFEDIARVSARLIKCGYDIYSPVVHFHPIAMLGGIDPFDHDFWLAVFDPWMMRCDALIVAMMDGWEQSEGIKIERRAFRDAGKPVIMMDPLTLSPFAGEFR